MVTRTESRDSVSRGLLTDAEREYLRGEKDMTEIEDPDAYRYRVRSNFRKPMERLDEDIKMLRAAGEDDLVREFHEKFGRVERLEREVERLRDELAEERDN